MDSSFCVTLQGLLAHPLPSILAHPPFSHQNVCRDICRTNDDGICALMQNVRLFPQANTCFLSALQRIQQMAAAAATEMTHPIETNNTASFQSFAVSLSLSSSWTASGEASPPPPPPPPPPRERVTVNGCFEIFDRAFSVTCQEPNHVNLAFLGAVVMYNMALNHHLMFLATGRTCFSRRAMKLYQKALGIVRHQHNGLCYRNNPERSLFVLALVNNLGHVSASLSEQDMVQECFVQLNRHLDNPFVTQTLSGEELTFLDPRPSWRIPFAQTMRQPPKQASVIKDLTNDDRKSIYVRVLHTPKSADC